MDATAQRTAFVFAGGGSLGAVQVGMLRALFATELRPDFVVGSSVGAINAAYLAGNPTPDGVADLEALWRSVRRRDVFPLSFTRLAGLFFHPDYVVESNGLRALIERHLPYASLEDARIPAHVMATDQQGVSIALSHGPAVEAILASTAIPGIYPPVQVDGHWLMDGAISADTPILHAIELGATRVVVFPTGYACALKAPPRGIVAKALHAITLMIAWRLMRDIDAALAAGVRVHLAPALCPLVVSPYDFSATSELIERAARSTRHWIERGGLERQADPQELAAHGH